MHILLMDPLEKLDIKKDSTLLFAHTLKKMGEDVCLLFEDDFYFSNGEQISLKMYDFSSDLDEKSFYLNSFSTKNSYFHNISKSDTLHMRIDPPFDSRYLRYLWMLRGLEKMTGVKILNSAEGILIHNEKIYSYEQPGSLASYVGKSVEGAKKFFEAQKQNDFILKPVDLFQGIGVEKIEGEISHLLTSFERKIKEYDGPVVIQPFMKEVGEGEIRSLFFGENHLGSILKVPPKGEFLANIAQGAKFHQVELEQEVFDQCLKISKELLKWGVPWVAYDILGGKVQEVNITCPGLLVEVSHAVGENLAEKIVELL